MTAAHRVGLRGATRPSDHRQILLFASAFFITASAVIGGVRQTVAGSLLICGGLLLILALRAGVAQDYAPPQMPTRNVRLITRGAEILGSFFALMGVALVLTHG